MPFIQIYIDAYCPRCDSDDIECTDSDENTYFCRCKDCGKRFEKMRT